MSREAVAEGSQAQARSAAAPGSVAKKYVSPEGRQNANVTSVRRLEQSLMRDRILVPPFQGFEWIYA